MNVSSIPRAPIQRSHLTPLLRPIRAFLASSSASGVILIVAALTALIWANSPASDSYHRFWHAELSIRIAGHAETMPLEHVVNDALMAIFFLLVGLEIKRELIVGELCSLRRAALPIVAAVGGMIVPAIAYLAFNHAAPDSKGWAIPMATDIAFAAGVLAMVGRGVPNSLKVFLLAVAIIDDLGSVLVIALFYTGHISTISLAIAGAFFAALVILNLLRVHRPWPYIVLGVGLWIAMYHSGVHATIAGVLLALTIPATRQMEEQAYVDFLRDALELFQRDTTIAPDNITSEQSSALTAIHEASQAVQTPLARLEHALLLPVNFIIMPLFALANAGVNLRAAGVGALHSPVAWGVLLGLLIGKPAGVLIAATLACKVKLASMPTGATKRQLVGIAFLCGIGFTMSLFIAMLAFGDHPEVLVDAKIAIFAASIIAGAVGAIVLRPKRVHPT